MEVIEGGWEIVYSWGEGMVWSMGRFWTQGVWRIWSG